MTSEAKKASGVGQSICVEESDKTRRAREKLKKRLEVLEKKLLLKLTSSAEFTVTEHHLDVFGVCRKCKTKTNP